MLQHNRRDRTAIQTRTPRDGGCPRDGVMLKHHLPIADAYNPHRRCNRTARSDAAGCPARPLA
jgi:hypothetical protein